MLRAYSGRRFSIAFRRVARVSANGEAHRETSIGDDSRVLVRGDEFSRNRYASASAHKRLAALVVGSARPHAWRSGDARPTTATM